MLTLITRNRTHFRASEPKASEFPCCSEHTGCTREMAAFKRKSWVAGRRGGGPWSAGLSGFPFTAVLCVELYIWPSSKLSALRSKSPQIYEEKNLSSPCTNSTLPKNNACNFGDKGKPASREEGEKNGLESFQRMAIPPSEDTESLIKPMRWEGVKGNISMNFNHQDYSWQAALALSSDSIESQRQKAPKWTSCHTKRQSSNFSS